MRITLICIFGLMAGSCGKSAFLDKKPSSSLALPKTLEDFSALLDNVSTMNVTPSFGELSTDNYFLTAQLWNTLQAPEKGIYVWASDIYDGVQRATDWSMPYQQVYIANLVLEGLRELPVSAQRTALTGSALFFRAHAFYQLAQVFAPPYDARTAAADEGLPLKLTTAIDQTVKRSSIEQTYGRIVADLQEAVQELPPKADPQFRNRPSKAAAYGMLARVYLVLENYEKSAVYADSLLQLHSALIDYNLVPASSGFYSFPFDPLNEETIFQATSTYTNLWYAIGGIGDQASVDTLLYNSYDQNDLRRGIFFFVQPNGAISLNGSYCGSLTYALPFSGIATDEFFLVRAESLARLGKPAEAMADINRLLERRFQPGSFVPYVTSDAEEALDIVLRERRKELVFRGRWQDLRRLNQQGKNIVIRRVIGSEVYTLEPGSAYYTLPIPQEEVAASGIKQNPR